jgi:hypothetical protein
MKMRKKAYEATRWPYGKEGILEIERYGTRSHSGEIAVVEAMDLSQNRLENEWENGIS